MKLNEDTLKGKWQEVKGEVRKAWGKLTDDELETTKGDMTAIGGLIQQKYGEQKESYSEKLSEILKRFTHKKDQKIDEFKDSLRE